MKGSKFSDAQKAFILKLDDDGFTLAEICRKAGISQATYFARAQQRGQTGGIIFHNHSPSLRAILSFSIFCERAWQGRQERS
ncbi:hypothetical protein CIT26_17755 [Mesorhizobium temperatum]|uniref:Transposase n=1 Tax=Mesorhizobium temperatum TaxID=241416 RepID=A0A271LJG5_9HYPH|nr:hypothetical protein CIT26_17755 [Mesorhizobium temperatum]